MQKFAYLDSSVVSKILTVDRFTRFDATGQAGTILEGRVARIHGFDIFESQMIDKTGSPAAYHNIVYARPGIVLTTRPLPLDGNGRGAVQSYVNDEDTGVSLRITESYDTELLGVKMTMDVLFGGKVVDNRYVVEVESF
jgi:hypothetical protein